MKDVYVYMGRDNSVSLRLRSELHPGEQATDPPLQGATKVVLELEDGREFSTSGNNPELRVESDDTLVLQLGVAFENVEPGDAITGQLSVYYTDKPNGIAWPGSLESPNLPTFRFLPVDWKDKP